jgi:hypothetical protein
MILTLTQKKLKTKLGQTPGDRRRQNVQSEDETCAPVIIRALGTIKKGLYHNLQLLPGHRSANELQ